MQYYSQFTEMYCKLHHHWVTFIYLCYIYFIFFILFTLSNVNGWSGSIYVIFLHFIRPTRQSKVKTLIRKLTIGCYDKRIATENYFFTTSAFAYIRIVCMCAYTHDVWKKFSSNHSKRSNEWHDHFIEYFQFSWFLESVIHIALLWIIELGECENCGKSDVKLENISFSQTTVPFSHIFHMWFQIDVM